MRNKPFTLNKALKLFLTLNFEEEKAVIEKETKEHKNI